jgi:acrylyl-CoA reductase (NADPH)
VAAWERLSKELDTSLLATITQEIGLAQAITLAPELLAGKLRGRVVVNTNA